MPESLAVFNESGETTNYLVQARFDLNGQEYIAISSAEDMSDELLFLRVEIDGSGNTIYTKPFPMETRKLEEKYKSIKKLLN